MCDSSTRPAFIPAPNTARVNMRYSYLGSIIENVWYFEASAPFIAADLVTLVDSIHDNWVTTMKNHISNQCTLVEIQATALDTAIAPQFSASYSDAGALTGNPEPGSVTVAIKFATGMSGRSSRGRMYWPSMSDNEVTGNQVESATAAAMLSEVTTLFDDVETDTGAAHVVTSYCNGGAWRTTAVNTPILTYVLTDLNIDSQRRRLAGRGI